MNTKEAFEDPRIVMLEEIILDEYEHGKQVEEESIIKNALHHRWMILRELMQYDIQRIAETFDKFRQGTLEDEAGYCAVKSLEDVKAQDFILTPGRYVGIAEQEDDGEPFDEKMKRLTTELSGLFAESHRLEDEIKKQLGNIGFEIA